jgi:single-strand DNA-binding protein
MASLNRVTLIGNLGAAPETRYTQDGTPTATIRLATTEVWKDKQNGEKKEKTEWHRIVSFQGLANVVGEYLEKGSRIYVEGKMQTQMRTDKEGIERYTTEIIGKDLKMLGKKNGRVGGLSDDVWDGDDQEIQERN